MHKPRANFPTNILSTYTTINDMEIHQHVATRISTAPRLVEVVVRAPVQRLVVVVLPRVEVLVGSVVAAPVERGVVGVLPFIELIARVVATCVERVGVVERALPELAVPLARGRGAVGAWIRGGGSGVGWGLGGGGAFCWGAFRCGGGGGLGIGCISGFARRRGGRTLGCCRCC